MRVIDNRKVLAIDGRLIDDRSTAATVVVPFDKDPDDPVDVPYSPWETSGWVPGLVCADRAAGGYRMFFSSYDGGKAGYPVGTATSTDGLTWQKHPQCLDDPEFYGVDRRYQSMSVCHRPEGSGDEYRYYAFLLFRDDPDGGLPLRVYFKRSRDGLSWEWLERSRYWDGCSDVINLLWDPTRQRYVSYHKLWRVTGTDVAGLPFRGYFTSFDHQPAGPGRVRVRGRRLGVPDEEREVDQVLLVGEGATDDGGGGYVTDQLQMVRVVARAESHDFVTWERNAVILEPADDAPPDEQLYGMPVFLYEGMYFGLPRHFEGRSGRLTTRLAWSTAGVTFTAPPVEVIDRGPAGAWDAGMVLAAAEPVIVGDRMCVHYGGYDHDHTVADGKTQMRTGRAWLRLDGFACRTGGLLVTELLRSDSRCLRLNASGRVHVVLRTVPGDVVRSATWSGDSVNAAAIQCDEPLSASSSFRLEFDLSDGRLYSFTLG